MPVDKFGNEIRQRGSTVKSDEGISLSFANNTYIRLDGESDITGNLNMALRKIENLGEPTNPKDATSKEYVDNTKGTGVIGEVKDETAKLKGNLDFVELYRIKNLPAPVDGKDGVNREYIDNLAINHPFEFKDKQYKAKTDLDLQGYKVKNVCYPFEDGDAATKGYIDSIESLKLDEGKYEAKGDIDMDKLYTVYNVKEPIEEGHITDKKYVDEQINLNSAFSKKKGGYEAKNDLYMRKNKLLGLPDPKQPGEAVNKKYVDDKIQNLFLDENDNIAFGLNVDMEGNKIYGLPEPTTDQEPATKKYVDDLQTQNVDEKGNIKFGRNINLDRNRIFSMKEPIKPSEGANKKYVDDTIDKRIQEEKDNFLPQDPATKTYVDEAIRGIAGGDVLVSKEGVFIKENGHYRATAPLDIDNQKVENIPDPVDEKDAVNKKYIDEIVEDLTLKQGLVRENGGFNLVDSYINMNFNDVRNLGLPKNENDGVPRKFVDSMIKEVEEKIKKRKHLIAASASYHGDLKKGEYQFTFGGQSNPSYKKHDMFSGFLVPSNGYIKKITVLETGIRLNLPENRDILDYIFYDIGYNTTIPLFTFVLISYLEEPKDIGTLYFYFTELFKNDQTKRNYTFKFNPNFKKKDLITVKTRDIINIRSEYNSIKLSENSYLLSNSNYNIDINDSFTYLLTFLIELDPLENEDDD